MLPETFPGPRTMRVRNLHPFDVTYREAVRIQQELAAQVSLRPSLRNYRYVAGADIAYSRRENSLFAAVTVQEYPSGKEVFSRARKGTPTFPYIPGLLSFRETPLLLQLFEELPITPDLLICDGQGLAHPRRFGLACHVGLLLDIPSVGCAKSRLVGEYQEPGKLRGCQSPLTYKDDIVGAVVRTKDNVKPVFVSPGHKVDVDTAVKVVLETCRGYRLPEPTRIAHLLSQKAKKGM
jgi:deoxyribonuclease V